MRLIDADALVYESIDSSDTLRHESYYGTGILAIRKEDIDDAPTIEPERRWIPCSERLPEENQNVLLLMPHNMVVGFWEDVFYDGGRTWYANSGDTYLTDMDVLDGYDDPIAWMPLPEPWKGEACLN